MTTSTPQDNNDTKTTWDHLVYIRLFEGCNLNCEHCFIPSNPKKIDLSFYKDNGLANTLKAYTTIKPNESVLLQWHGGEPTMLGTSYLNEAITLTEKDTTFNFIHSIQTNLMNFHESPSQWAEIYHKYFNSQIGVSWDYGIRHVKRNKTSEETNKEYELKFWQNHEIARSFGLNMYFVITVTKLFFEKYKNPLDFFEFIVSKGVTHLNFERITNNGNARENWGKLGLNNLEYSENMSKFFKYYRLFKQNNPNIKLNISPFDGLYLSVSNLDRHIYNQKTIGISDVLSFKNQGYGCWSGSCDTKFHTIDSNGYKHGCTALTSEQDNNNKMLQHNIQNKKIVWLGKSNLEQQENILSYRAERQRSCQECEFLTICSSGCLSVDKFDESGECSGAKKLFTTIRDTYTKGSKSPTLIK